MMTHVYRNALVFSVIAIGMTATFGMADDGDSEKYVFRYKFQPGEVLQWEVTAQVSQLTTFGSNRDNSETLSITTKNWKVLDVDANGTAILEYRFPDVSMSSRSSSEGIDRKYDSKTDTKPPVEFLDVAELVNEPIAHFTINTKGEILKRTQKAKVAATMQFAETAEENRITIPMPEHAISVGDAWDYAREISIPQPNGTVKKVSVRERYKLEKVQNGVATFDFKTHIITPLHDDKDTDWALRTKIRNGKIQFDMIEGRSISQQYDVKKTVMGIFHGGHGSASYQSRFVEKNLRNEPEKVSMENRNATK
ncbi:MAG: hypothetical protein FWH27_03495 [Planctomycetaceae bacterium]|nr:hypothetical protein [Planctomycetaceae bacterium]